MPKHVATPELDKMLGVNRQSQAIGEFLDWLGTKGITLMTYQEIFEDREQLDALGYNKIDQSTGEVLMNLNVCVFKGHTPVGASIEKLLAQHFEIDLDKCEEERRAILDALRQRPAA